MQDQNLARVANAAAAGHLGGRGASCSSDERRQIGVQEVGSSNAKLRATRPLNQAPASILSIHIRVKSVKAWDR